tara:strand:+ start:14810 stop:15040 length:231 start_codon:yes stop_codon:yes gene_type:complete
MSLVGLQPPRMPEPPEEINRRYMIDLVRALEVFINQERTAGELRASKITLTDLPTSPSGLETGALYNDSGTVKIVT